jgi:hypothetical protein
MRTKDFSTLRGLLARTWLERIRYRKPSLEKIAEPDSSRFQNILELTGNLRGQLDHVVPRGNQPNVRIQKPFQHHNYLSNLFCVGVCGL